MTTSTGSKVASTRRNRRRLQWALFYARRGSWKEADKEIERLADAVCQPENEEKVSG